MKRLLDVFHNDEMFDFLDHTQNFRAFVVFHALANLAQSERVQIGTLLFGSTDATFGLGDFNYCHFAVSSVCD